MVRAGLGCLYKLGKMPHFHYLCHSAALSRLHLLGPAFARHYLHSSTHPPCSMPKVQREMKYHRAAQKARQSGPDLAPRLPYWRLGRPQKASEAEPFERRTRHATLPPWTDEEAKIFWTEAVPNSFAASNGSKSGWIWELCAAMMTSHFGTTHRVYSANMMRMSWCI